MKCRVLLFAFFLLTALPLFSSAAQQRRPTRETWYERALRQINPDDTDYGAIWEQRKKALTDRVRSPYFQYSLATTVTIVWLFIMLFAQHISHRRKQEVAVESIADVLRHDAYAREKAREAIQRYNDHIETCNRVIEAEVSGASKWVSSAELETLQSEAEQYRSEAVGLREETKRLREECEKHKATVAELSMHSRSDAQATLPLANDTRMAELVTRVNELQDDLIAERKKNQRIKANSVQ